MLVETINSVRAHGGDTRTLRLYGQEVNLTTAAIARMNLFLHEIEDFKIVRGDTLRSPGLRKPDGTISQFDVVIANPPFSLSNWGADTWTADARSFCGVPPTKNGELLAAAQPLRPHHHDRPAIGTSRTVIGRRPCGSATPAARAARDRLYHLDQHLDLADHVAGGQDHELLESQQRHCGMRGYLVLSPGVSFCWTWSSQIVRPQASHQAEADERVVTHSPPFETKGL